MRILTNQEVNEVSGAGLADFITGALAETAAAALGAIMGATSGMAKAAMAAGDNGGGILGLGIVAELGGLIVGGVSGAVQGAAYGVLNGLDATAAQFNAVSNQWLDMSAATPTVG